MNYYWGTRYSQYLIIAKSLTKLNGSFKTRNLAQKVGISHRVALRYVEKFIQKNDASMIREWEYATN